MKFSANKLSLVLIVLFAVKGISQKTIVGNIIHDGIVRDYRLYVPSVYQSSNAVPLIINLHGFTSNAMQQEFYGDFRPIADTAGFLLVHPNGTKEPITGQTYWNAGQTINGVDDIGFLENLVDSLSKQYNIDQNKVYVTGISNGGIMCYYLACHSNRFAAFASVAGAMYSLNQLNCKPTKSFPIVEIHGDADPIVPYNGGSGLMSVDQTMAYWLDKNKCNTNAQVIKLLDKNANDGCTATLYNYEFCGSNSKMQLYKIINGGHTWPGAKINIGSTCQDFDASEVIWLFFKNFKLSTSVNNNSKKEYVEIEYNRVSNELKVQAINNTEINSIIVYSLDGKKLIATKNPIINLSNLPMGILCAVIQSSSGMYSYKIVR